MIRTHSLLTPRLALVWAAAALLLGLAVAAALSNTRESARADDHAAGSETLVVTPSEADFVPGKSPSPTTVWIYGSGFTPSASVLVLISDQRGVDTDIGALSGIDVAANEDGAFGFKWTFGRFTRSGVGGEGMMSVRAVDAGSFDELATAPLALCNLNRNADLEEGAEPAEVPSHCSS